MLAGLGASVCIAALIFYCNSRAGILALLAGVLVWLAGLGGTAAAAPKEGKACATTILGWVATGDASIQAAKTAGGISTVAVVDHSAKNILGIFGEWCTIVRGN
jgi:O-antigen ligase